MGGTASVVSQHAENVIVKPKSLTNVVDSSSSFRMSMIDLTFPDHEWRTKIVHKSQESRELIRNAIKNKFLFRDFDDKQLNDIIDVFKPIHCNKGQEIVKAGRNGEYM
jgi:hypothetical protein